MWKISKLDLALITVILLVCCGGPIALALTWAIAIAQISYVEITSKPVALGCGTQLEIRELTRCCIRHTADGGLVQEIPLELDSVYEFAPIEGATGYVYQVESSEPILHVRYGIVGAGSWVTPLPSLDAVNAELVERGCATVEQRDFIQDYDIMRAGVFPPR